MGWRKGFRSSRTWPLWPTHRSEGREWGQRPRRVGAPARRGWSSWVGRTALSSAGGSLSFGRDVARPRRGSPEQVGPDNARRPGVGWPGSPRVPAQRAAGGRRGGIPGSTKRRQAPAAPAPIQPSGESPDRRGWRPAVPWWLAVEARSLAGRGVAPQQTRPDTRSLEPGVSLVSGLVSLSMDGARKPGRTSATAAQRPAGFRGAAGYSPTPQGHRVPLGHGGTVGVCLGRVERAGPARALRRVAGW